MSLFYELNPELAKVRREDVIASRFVADALSTLGVRPGPDAPDETTVC